MAEPFLSEIRLMSFTFPPKGWARCDGQLLPINQNQALFSLLGTTFGGDGRTTFALPDLRGRVPIHVSGGYTLGQRGGEEYHTLTRAEMAQHGHGLQFADAAGNAAGPSATALPARPETAAYGVAGSATALDDRAVAVEGGGNQPHPNQGPYLTLSYCIALQGIFPSPT